MTDTQAPQRQTRMQRRLRTAASVPVTAWIGFVVIAIYLFAAIFAPLLAPYGEAELVGRPFQPWGDEFRLGTDQLGRDLLSRLIYGARNTIGIAALTTMLSFFIGVSLGLLAVVRGGLFDHILSRASDVLMSIPQLIFALLLLSAFGATAVNLILILAIIDSTRVFRLARATAISVVAMDYYEAARIRGEGVVWMMRREILPNILPPLIAEVGLRFCFVFLAISGLSFLGVGIQPPTADWGSMVRESATLISYGNIMPLLPAAAIAILTIAVNFVADWFLNQTSGLRDAK
ncbi:ABC transporter permease [Roseovarius aestuarii]|nr:ABC transporter permease [Roseovarius aestuarii]